MPPKKDSRPTKEKKTPRPSDTPAEANTSIRDDNPEDQAADSDVPTGNRPVNVKLLGRQVDAPEYISWSKGDSNPEYPFYLYKRKERFGEWELLTANDEKKLDKVVNGVKDDERVPGLTFASEHIFELQELGDLFNFRAIKSSLSKHANLKVAFKDKAVLGDLDSTGELDPLTFLRNALPNGPQAFVYLEERVNGLKGVYFKRTMPQALNEKKAPKNPDAAQLKTIVEKVILTHLIVDYLKHPDIERVYKGVSTTMRSTWVDIGGVFSENASYANIGKCLDWGRAYDDWEIDFIDYVEANMQKAIRYGYNTIKDSKVLPEGMKNEDDRKAFLKKVTKALKGVDLSNLKRYLDGEALPDLDPDQQNHMNKIIKGIEKTRIDDDEQEGAKGRGAKGKGAEGEGAEGEGAGDEDKEKAKPVKKAQSTETASNSKEDQKPGKKTSVKKVTEARKSSNK